MKLDIIHNEDCLGGMERLSDNSIDLIATDPPYGIKFMGKLWDKALPDIKVWRECLRVLKSGSFVFIMCIPRQDCLARMIVSLEDAGFNVSFTSIYWCYASGFPKAQNIGKAVDKRKGAKREVIGKRTDRAATPKIDIRGGRLVGGDRPQIDLSDITSPATPQAQALDGSYGGFQPKPAVEVVIVAMKPLSEKTYVDQALNNRKGITWLDGGRIPFIPETDPNKRGWQGSNFIGGNPFAIGKHDDTKTIKREMPTKGRFPANLLVSDDALNDGRDIKSGWQNTDKGNDLHSSNYSIKKTAQTGQHYSDSGSFSRYFSLDAWFSKKLKELPAGVQKTFPFLIVPKASKAEKNRGCEGLEEKQGLEKCLEPLSDPRMNRKQKRLPNRNYHPTVKPIKLFSYLITLGSREGDIILDPFIGSGTTAIAARMLGRRYIGFEVDKDYCEIAKRRLAEVQLALI